MAPPKRGRTESVTIRTTPEVRKIITDYAEAMSITQTAVVEMALRDLRQHRPLGRQTPITEALAYLERNGIAIWEMLKDLPIADDVAMRDNYGDEFVDWLRREDRRDRGYGVEA